MTIYTNVKYSVYTRSAWLAKQSSVHLLTPVWSFCQRTTMAKLDNIHTLFKNMYTSQLLNRTLISTYSCQLCNYCTTISSLRDSKVIQYSTTLICTLKSIYQLRQTTYTTVLLLVIQYCVLALIQTDTERSQQADFNNFEKLIVPPIARFIPKKFDIIFNFAQIFEFFDIYAVTEHTHKHLIRGAQNISLGKRPFWSYF